MMTVLEAARDDLATIPGVKSCAIGVEPNISPADYPMIRIVPSRITPGAPYGKRTAETLIYFGINKTTSEGLESVYEALFELEALILSKMQALGHRYIETITDEDRLDAFKLMTIRIELR
jgi:hypothetical protein